jgi:hypothetical protein
VLCEGVFSVVRNKGGLVLTCYLPQSFVDVVGGAAVNLTGIAGDCVAKPILVVHKSALRSRLLWFRCLIILPDFGWTEFQIEL